MKVETIINPDEKIHNDGSMGLIHLDKKYRELENHPDTLKHKPASPFGSAYLAKFDNSDFFTWIKPVSGGKYRSCNPLFKVTA